MTIAELIQRNAEKLCDLNDAIYSTLPRRNESAACNDLWVRACRHFHESYDALAFPGGLGEGLRMLAAHDPNAIEYAIIFLEVDPLFFRSGYIKEDILRHLRKVDLQPSQKHRLQQVILARICDQKTKREFRRYCQLAPYVNDPAFQQEIQKLSGRTGTKPQRAQWVLDRLLQGVPKNKTAE